MSEAVGDSGRYSKLGKQKRRKSDFHASTNGFSNLSPPQDTYNSIYAAFILGGAGFLLPYNSFIMAMDYFKVRYPGTPVVFDMSLVYIVVAFITVLGNNLLVETFTLSARINFGYFISFVTLIFVITCELWWEVFGELTSYTVNLGAVAVVAVGCTVQQSSFYGYTSMLPSRYTQAVMVGESASGVFMSLVRVLTRLLVSEIRGSTFYFFQVSASAVATCFAMYHLIRRTDFIQFYIALSDRAKTRITLEPTEDAGLIETTDSRYGVLKIQSSPPPTGTALSFTNPVYEPSAPAPTYKVEDVVIRGRTSTSARGGVSGIRRGIQSRWEITKAIYPYMISICLAYFTTLCMYPGVVSEITSCNLGSWMPVLMMSMFNGADLFGKMISSSSSYWTGWRLVRFCVIRLFLIPLILMCAMPRASPLLSEEIFPFFFVLVLGLTNGVFGSVPIIQAPSKVEDYHRELTGNMMTLSYNFGLTTGSLMAYFLESLVSNADPVCNYIHDKLPNSLQNISVNFSTISSSTTLDITTIASVTSTIMENVYNSTDENV
ncbi:hypothetical protein PPYR_10033 [Photinus pyralis]|uniref:Equilibrative nucleoside transporter 4 n=3 Tax=Photinus pyralis TaxID=7054 RepID=A0A5N4AF67_PHOPY|nr:equilibrative nucleoside transporter 4 [Photinus pyralis]KAB0795972.1 hypothetical protein PPYR_10033 [Photinus pyralis]